MANVFLDFGLQPASSAVLGLHNKLPFDSRRPAVVLVAVLVVV